MRTAATSPSFRGRCAAGVRTADMLSRKGRNREKDSQTNAQPVHKNNTYTRLRKRKNPLEPRREGQKKKNKNVRSTKQGGPHVLVQLPATQRRMVLLQGAPRVANPPACHGARPTHAMTRPAQSNNTGVLPSRYSRQTKDHSDTVAHHPPWPMLRHALPHRHLTGTPGSA